MDEASRLIELETRLAYQESLLHDLNDVVARQQREIERLGQACRTLAERMARAAQEPVKSAATEDEIPPHY